MNEKEKTISQEDYELSKHVLYWAGRLIGYDQDYEVAEEIVEAIDYAEKILPKGFPTHTKDITGRTICLGDRVGFDFTDDTSEGFEVVFEANAFRKKYKGQAVGSILGDQHEADKMRYIVLGE